MNIAYLGPQLTFTHIAARNKFLNIPLAPHPSIKSIFISVLKEYFSYGVIPIQNSVEGSIGSSFDFLLEYDLKICGEIYLPISLCLLCPVQIKPIDIEEIYSNYYASSECKHWIDENCPDAIMNNQMVSTSDAIIHVATKTMSDDEKDIKMASIGSREAGEFYGMKIIQSDIQDFKNNTTRFLVIGKMPFEKTLISKTTISFSVMNVPGELYKILDIFYKNSVNLTMIESRPHKSHPFEYYFFVDMEGHSEDPNIKKMLKEIKEEVLFFKFLGSYPDERKVKNGSEPV